MEWFTPFKTSNDVDLDRLIQKTMEIPDVQKELIEYNQSQLQEGIDSQGKRIRTISAEEQGNGQVYSLFTIAEKAKKGQDFGNVTLYDTGEFYNSMQIKAESNETKFLADFDKPDGNIYDNFEISKYDFLGLTNENLDSFLWFVFIDYFITFYLQELEK
jgi:hypothetical protein